MTPVTRLPPQPCTDSSCPHPPLHFLPVSYCSMTPVDPREPQLAPTDPPGFHSLRVPPAPPGTPTGPFVGHLVPCPPFPTARGPPQTRSCPFRGRGQGTHPHPALRSVSPFLFASQAPSPSTCPLVRCVMLSCEKRVGTLTRGVIYKYVIIY